MNVDNVEKALEGTRLLFDKGWQNPDLLEKEVFYEFLVMQSFFHLQLSPDLLSDFWTSRNTDLVDKLGAKAFEYYGLKRDERFKNYMPSYNALAELPCFKIGSNPEDHEEFMAIQKFTGVVFHHVEKEFISSLDAEASLNLANRCLQVRSLHEACIFEEGA